jgi:large subunit ribosomal protein L29
MKSAELRGMGDEQLSLALKDELKNLFHLRFQSATERLETPSQIKKAKRQIARIKTLLRERELEAQKQAATKETKANG